VGALNARLTTSGASESAPTTAKDWTVDELAYRVLDFALVVMLDSPGKPAKLPRLMEASGTKVVLSVKLTTGFPIGGD
jgi:hypothetical protein